MAQVAEDEFADALDNLEVEDIQELQERDPEPEPEAHGQGGYRFDSPLHQQQLKEQRAQLWNWLKKVGTHMFKEGINLTKISLPVCLFEPRSFLERLTTNWEYNPLLLAAAGCGDPLERMRYVVAFAVSGLCRQVSFHKPFNPVLGETYQAAYPNGLQVYCEQISHHPPISSWELYEPSGKFVFYGNGNWVAGIKGNSVKGRQTGSNCVRFGSDGATLEYELPGLQVKGVLWGVRVLKYGGQMAFKDKQNNITAVVDVDPQPQTSLLSGWFRAKKPQHKPDQVVGKLYRGEELVDSCQGCWLSHLDWEKPGPPVSTHGNPSSNSSNRGGSVKGSNGNSSNHGSSGGGSGTPSSSGSSSNGGAGGKGALAVVGGPRRFWDLRGSPLVPAVPLASALPSDCRHREDVVALVEGDQDRAQTWKHTLEERQRRDRKLRKEGGGYEH